MPLINGQWVEDPTMDPEKPAYALFTGGQGMVSTEVKSDFSTVRRDAIKRAIDAGVDSEWLAGTRAAMYLRQHDMNEDKK